MIVTYACVIRTGSDPEAVLLDADDLSHVARIVDEEYPQSVLVAACPVAVVAMLVSAMVAEICGDQLAAPLPELSEHF